MDLGIKGRIALVSGADLGMGKETARLLIEAGVRVAITDKPDGTLICRSTSGRHGADYHSDQRSKRRVPITLRGAA